MPSIVKTPTAADFLALVPQLTGFHPRDSVVLVAFVGNRTRGAIRFDLPATERAAFYGDAATSMIGMLSRLEGVDGVVPVVYTDDPFGAVVPYGDLVGALEERASFSGFRVEDALCVAADGWGSYYDTGCPPGGNDLAEITASTAHDQIPAEDRRELGDVLRGAHLPEVDFATRERVGRLVARFDDDPREDDSQELRLLRELCVDLPDFLEGLIEEDPTTIPDWAAAVVILTVRSAAARDVALFQWAFDLAVGDETLGSGERYNRGGGADAIGANRMLGEGPRPDPRRLDRAIALTGEIAARAPRSHTPPLLTMIAWYHWALGRSSAASVFVGRALEVDGGYGLAEIMATVLNAGMLPDWAFGDDQERARRWRVEDAAAGRPAAARPSGRVAKPRTRRRRISGR